MTIILLRTDSSSTNKVVNFLILVTFQIKDFEGHYLKLVVLQGFTQFGPRNILYFNDNYITDDWELIANWSIQLLHTCDLPNQGFQRSLFQTSVTSWLYLIWSFDESYITEVRQLITSWSGQFHHAINLQTKDFEGHFFKVVVLPGYTQLFLINIVYFSGKKYIIEVQEQIPE